MKTKRIDAQRAAWIACEIVALVAMLMVLLWYASIGEAPDAHASLQQLHIAGEYQLDGGEWTRTLPSPLRLSRSLSVRGRLSRDVPEGELIHLRIENLLCAISLNGRAIYEPEAPPIPSLRAIGNGWFSFASPGILNSDEITVQLDAVYRAPGPAAVQMLENLYAGSRSALVRAQIQKSNPALCIYASILAFSLVLAPIIAILRITGARWLDTLSSLLVFVLACCLWFLTRDATVLLFLDNPILSYIANIVGQYLISTFGLLYARSFVNGPRKTALLCCELVAVVYITLGSALVAVSAIDYGTIEPIGAILNIIFISAMLGCIGYEAIKDSGSSARWLLLSAVPMLFTGLSETVNYLVQGRFATGMFYSIGFVFFIGVQVALLVRQHRISAARAMRMEAEVAQTRISIMLSQIQPHFLYNTLIAIKQLCDIDPKLAKQTVVEFTDYLRANLDSLTITEPIPFEDELRHVQTYLALEQRRFGDKVRVSYDIPARGFRLPALTLQTMVENAVHHGVTRREEGGSVTIRTMETPAAHLITVSDDGVGFDPKEPNQDGRTHTGIVNVRSRLQSMVNGSLQIDSAIGIGTTATIIIPKQEQRP